MLHRHAIIGGGQAVGYAVTTFINNHSQSTASIVTAGVIGPPPNTPSAAAHYRIFPPSSSSTQNNSFSLFHSPLLFSGLNGSTTNTNSTTTTPPPCTTNSNNLIPPSAPLNKLCASDHSSSSLKDGVDHSSSLLFSPSSSSRSLSSSSSFSVPPPLAAAAKRLPLKIFADPHRVTRIANRSSIHSEGLPTANKSSAEGNGITGRGKLNHRPSPIKTPYRSFSSSSSPPSNESNLSSDSEVSEEEIFTLMDKQLDERLNSFLNSDIRERPSTPTSPSLSSSNELLSKIRRLDLNRKELELFIHKLRADHASSLKLTDYIALLSSSGKLNPVPAGPYNNKHRLKNKPSSHLASGETNSDKIELAQLDSLPLPSQRKQHTYWRLTLDIYDDVLQHAKVDAAFLPNLQFYNQAMDSFGKAGMWVLSVRVFHQMTLARHLQSFEEELSEMSAQNLHERLSGDSDDPSVDKQESLLDSQLRYTLENHPALQLENHPFFSSTNGDQRMPPPPTEGGPLHRGYLPDVITFTILINACARAGKGKEALVFLNIMERDYQITPDRMAYTAVIHACAKSGQPKAALSVWRRMHANGTEPNTISYNALINAFAKDKDVNTAFILLDEMLASPYQPSVVTYTTLLHACAQGKDWERAQRVWKIMQEKNLNKGLFTYNCMLTAACACGMLDTAILMLQKEMPANRLRPDALSYGVIINALVSKGDDARALEIFTAMKENRVKPDVYVYNAIMRSEYLRSTIIIQLFYEMQNRYRIKPNIVIYRDVIAACIRENRWAEVSDLLKSMMKRPVRPDNALIQMLHNAAPPQTTHNNKSDQQSFYQQAIYLLNELQQATNQQQNNRHQQHTPSINAAPDSFHSIQHRAYSTCYDRSLSSLWTSNGALLSDASSVQSSAAKSIVSAPNTSIAVSLSSH